jgi:hypothetical protein
VPARRISAASADSAGALSVVVETGGAAVMRSV